MMGIRVIVAGANGRMGREVVKMLSQHEHLQLVGAVSRSEAGKDVGETLGLGRYGLSFTSSVAEVLNQTKADVLVDFTTPHVVAENMELAIQAGVRPVVGTSGLPEKEIERLSSLCQNKGIGAIIAPNFAIGAVLMMIFAKQAAKYMPHVEIIESHHDRKLDAPSGTAVKTAEMIVQTREEMKQGHPEEKEILDGARGAYYQGFRIHSVRLPGLVAHQEVLFGGNGQLLTLRHDSLNRESFMPGVKLAIEKVIELDKLVYGLENILD
ncbi:4-hydroxy-tetrahydrodipicolinate reductase [Thermoactinomyces sp. CICC 10521]|uniref:4-hydroxy-tetrahydrodipicolinate reductase n=2 Tax=Thermoactinomycetaceae TaxID=186824 RepID=A0A7W2AIE2_9BACL|nr:4-hydroxy-tetrahydrodipicolinate reductase [Thermoactinomyces daqus]MBH8596599.1 4-hydroxy-tetrahydrodipicolinate reductase [Thermoactinomyces sp. CICC 10523]MBH8603361.1 4-hydroxy-tetrahydrodipicolinate reductase [Thermoactinomyces sp. CICC 10522]MBH8607872.1 4-hydroxy-tetrahydrodipicolinate reductase [Thermoactinomyces sp. CICC 10521]